MPIFGGTLLVNPITTIAHGLGGAANVPGAGTVSLPLSIPGGTAVLGARLTFQCGYFDVAAVQSISLTRGLEMLID